jgi:hypothetical protein
MIKYFVNPLTTVAYGKLRLPITFQERVDVSKCNKLGAVGISSFFTIPLIAVSIDQICALFYFLQHRSMLLSLLADGDTATGALCLPSGSADSNLVISRRLSALDTSP